MRAYVEGCDRHEDEEVDREEDDEARELPFERLSALFSDKIPRLNNFLHHLCKANRTVSNEKGR